MSSRISFIKFPDREKNNNKMKNSVCKYFIVYVKKKIKLSLVPGS